MKLQTFLDELYEAGWRGTHDAQYAGVTRIWRNAYPAAAEYLDDLIAADSRIAELEASNAALRGAIERAPHADFCLGSSFRMADGTRADMCTCWKADALRAAGGERA